jgi:hypothetical protein
MKCVDVGTSRDARFGLSPSPGGVGGPTRRRRVGVTSGCGRRTRTGIALARQAREQATALTNGDGALPGREGFATLSVEDVDLAKLTSQTSSSRRVISWLTSALRFIVLSGSEVLARDGSLASANDNRRLPERAPLCSDAFAWNFASSATWKVLPDLLPFSPSSRCTIRLTCSRCGACARRGSARIANSWNPIIIGLHPRRSSLFVMSTSLLDVCTASLRVLRRVSLGVGLFFVTKPWWQVIQSGLSVANRCLELSKIGVRRSRSRSHSRFRGYHPHCLNDWAQQYRRQQGNDYH